MSQVATALFDFAEMDENELPDAVWQPAELVGEQQYQMPRRPVAEQMKEQQQRGHRRDDLTVR